MDDWTIIVDFPLDDGDRDTLQAPGEAAVQQSDCDANCFILAFSLLALLLRLASNFMTIFEVWNRPIGNLAPLINEHLRCDAILTTGDVGPKSCLLWGKAKADASSSWHFVANRN